MALICSIVHAIALRILLDDGVDVAANYNFSAVAFFWLSCCHDLLNY